MIKSYGVIILFFILALSMFAVSIVYGADGPILGAPRQDASFQRHLYPRTDDRYQLGSTTLRWNNIILGTATSTADNGFDITAGCYAVSGVCVAGGDAIGASFAWTPDTTYNENANSTSTPIWFKDTIYASSTAFFSDRVTFASTTQGSVYFAGVDGVLSEDNSNLFWDDTNNILAIEKTPQTPKTTYGALQVGVEADGAAFHFRREGGTNNPGLFVENTDADKLTTLNVSGTIVANNALGFAMGGVEKMRLVNTVNLLLLGGTASTTANTILGMDGSAIYNEQGSDVDFRIEGDTDSNLFLVDASTDRVGIATATPATLFSVDGVTNFRTSTSTFSSSGGLDIKNGCYAINGVCLVDTDTDTTYDASWPITLTGTTFGFDGLATTTAWNTGDLVYVVDGNTVTSVATTTVDCSGDISCTSFVALGSNSTISFTDDDFAFPWTPDTTYNENANSTSTPIWFKDNVYASSTLAVTNIATFFDKVGISTTSPHAQLSVENQAGQDAFVVGSSTGTSFIVDDYGWVGIGTSSPGQAGLSVAGGDIWTYSDGISGNYIQRTNTDLASAGGHFEFRRSRGSLSAFGIVFAQDELGQLRWTGYDGSNDINSADITAYVDGTPGTNDMPGRIVFSTTPDGSSSLVQRMVIKNDGNVGIGTSTPATILSVDGTANFRTSTTTFSSSGGIDIKNGCFAKNGECYALSSELHDPVTLAGTPDYITISGQVITRNTVDISDDTNLAVSDTSTIDMVLTGDTLSANGLYTAGDGLTLTTADFDCDTADSSTFGCLTAADWTTFNNKAIFAWTPDTTFNELANATTSPIWFKDTIYASSTSFFDGAMVIGLTGDGGFADGLNINVASTSIAANSDFTVAGNRMNFNLSGAITETYTSSTTKMFSTGPGVSSIVGHYQVSDKSIGHGHEIVLRTCQLEYQLIEAGAAGFSAIGANRWYKLDDSGTETNIDNDTTPIEGPAASTNHVSAISNEVLRQGEVLMLELEMNVGNAGSGSGTVEIERITCEYDTD